MNNREHQPKTKQFASYASLPYIGRFLTRHNIGTFLSQRNKFEIYVGTTKLIIKTKILEHNRSVGLRHLQESAIAEQHFKSANQIWRYRCFIDHVKFYTWLFREMIEVHKHWNQLNNKDERLRHNRVWYLVLRSTNNKSLTSTEPQVTPTSIFYQSEGSSCRESILCVPIIKQIFIAFKLLPIESPTRKHSPWFIYSLLKKASAVGNEMFGIRKFSNRPWLNALKIFIY